MSPKHLANPHKIAFSVKNKKNVPNILRKNQQRMEDCVRESFCFPPSKYWVDLTVPSLCTPGVLNKPLLPQLLLVMFTVKLIFYFVFFSINIYSLRVLKKNIY